MAVQYQRQWKVLSDKEGKPPYKVSLTMDGKYKCSCPHWIFRLQKTGEDCKHITDVKEGRYDAVVGFVFELAMVREAELSDDRMTILVPLIPAADVDFMFTLAYDLLMLGVPMDQIRARYDLPRSWRKDLVISYVKGNGRKIYGPRVQYPDGNWHFDGFEYHGVR